MSGEAKMTKIDKPISTLGGLFLVAGAALFALGYFGNRDGTMALQSYFYGYIFWLCLTLGCFGLQLLHHAARGHWGFPIQRFLESGGGKHSLIMMAVLFVPIAVGGPHLYHWMHPEVVAADPVLQHKAPYLNTTFWIIRAVIYFGVFAFIAHLLRTWSMKEDETGNDDFRAMRVNLAAPSILLFVLLSTFMFTDWVMSLDPHWFSTIYGVWFIVGQALAAMAFCAIIVGTQHDKAPFVGLFNPNQTKDMGNLLLAFTLLWAYFSFSQFLIIWSGDLPEFITYYAARSENGWNLVGGLSIIGQFFIPFLLLLAPRTKRIPRMFAVIGMWILLMRFVDIYYIVVPAFRPSGVPVITDLGALLLVGGAWLSMFAWRLRSAPLLVKRMPQLAVGAHDHA